MNGPCSRYNPKGYAYEPNRELTAAGRFLEQETENVDTEQKINNG